MLLHTVIPLSLFFVLTLSLGVEEALVRAAKRSAERGARRPAVLQEPAVPTANQDNQPQPVRTGKHKQEGEI